MSCEVRALVPIPIAQAAVIRMAGQALQRLGYPHAANLSIAFVGDRRMSALNRQYRRTSGPTDVLSFPGAGHELGEIVISVPQAKRQSRRFRQTVRAEIELLLVHGLLHLAGYDHKNSGDRLRMERAEQRLLSGKSLIRRAHETS